ncbi:hydroxypyruvate isomerase family protein [Neorhizobium sp. DT-125]|uniref:hydroxypyruvate isomerase family protein n=1 Tax=Neorhizobium sp. DT-125 TaxID=3396163 RepID=UPI003F1B9614
MSGFKYSAHVGYLFTDKPLSERIKAAAHHGFGAVEHPAPYSVEAQEMAQWLKEAGIVYTQFGLHAGDAQRGEKGIAIFPERREEFRRSVGVGLDYAEAIGVSMVHVMAGVLPSARRSRHHWDCYLENLAYAAREAESRGVMILIEAMSAGAVPNYFIETADQAADAAASTGYANVKLLFDVFHTVSTGLDVHEQIRKHASQILHVHIADYPGRHEPGSETLDFDAIRETLTGAGYRGWLGCEYIPAGQTEEGLGWLKV